MSRVLFVCVHNAGRSQMSAALLELVGGGGGGGGRHEARSAGSDPGEHVHPEVVEVMRELGIDLAERVPHLLDRADAEWADVVVTMGCGDACPYIPGKRYVDWDLTDPKGLPLDEVRTIRDDIRGRIERLVAELDLVATVRTDRLDLVLLERAFMQAYVDGKPLPDLGFADPDDFLGESADLVRWRLGQIAADSAQEPWLLRAIVDRHDAVAVGYVNFHAPPDERGMVEIGYRIVPSRRRQGYAAEAAAGMWQWAGDHGARVLRASIRPDNEPSLALIDRAGFVEVGSQIDEIDGLELIFEKPVQV
jgi:arsenate reductase